MFPKILQFLQFLFAAKNISTNPDLEEDTTAEVEEEEIIVEESALKTKVLSDEFIIQLKKDVFPFTPIKNIQENWPLIVEALDKKGLLDKDMVCYSLATILVENDKFLPLAEGISKWNTDKEPFDKYIGKLGNKDLKMAALYRGGSIIQLTGFQNYQKYDKKLNLGGGLIEQGYIAANEAHISAAIFAEFIADITTGVRKALTSKDFKKARSYVNGKAALHHEKLREAYFKIEKLLN